MTTGPDLPTTLRLAAAGLLVARGGEILAGPLDIAVGGGEALIVTGPNGAGKSSLLKVVAGLLAPAAGSVRIEGARGADGEPARRVAEAAHYLGHRNALKAAATLRGELGFWRDLLGGGAAGEAGGRDLDAALGEVGLLHAAHLPVGYLSAGQQRRAALARLLLAPRPVWILDEPTAALDAAGQALLTRLLAAHLGAGGLVLAATHQPLGIAARELRLGRVASLAGAPP